MKFVLAILVGALVIFMLNVNARLSIAVTVMVGLLMFVRMYRTR